MFRTVMLFAAGTALAAIASVRACAVPPSEPAAPREPVAAAPPDPLRLRLHPEPDTEPAGLQAIPERIIVTGTVRDAAGAGVAAARVACAGVVVASGPDGAFEAAVDHPASLPAAIEVSHPRHGRASLTFAWDRASGLDVRLPARDSLRGRVLTMEGGPVADAHVGCGVSATATTDRRGEFDLAPVEGTGVVELDVHAEGFASRRFVVSALASPVVLRVATGRLLDLTVVDDAGRPIADAEVVVANESRAWRWTFSTGPDGRIPRVGLSNEAHRVVATAPGRVPGAVRLRAGTFPFVERLALPSGCTLRVVAESPPPVPNAVWEFTIHPEDDSPNAPTARAGADGVATFPLLAPEARFTLSARMRGMRAPDVESPALIVARSVVAETGAARTISWRPPELREVRVVCRTADGTGVPDVRATFRSASRPGTNPFGSLSVADRVLHDAAASVSTDVDGRGRTWLEPGVHDVAVSAAGERIVAAPPSVDASESEPVVEIRTERGATIRGRVVSREGEPLAGRRVFALPKSGTGRSATTDAAGAFALAGLQWVDHTLHVEGVLGEQFARRVEDVAAPSEGVEIRIDTYTLRGRVTGAEVLPAKVLVLRGPSAYGAVEIVTDAAGRFSVSGLSARNWTLIADDGLHVGRWEGPVDRDLEVVIAMEAQ